MRRSLALALILGGAIATTGCRRGRTPPPSPAPVVAAAVAPAPLPLPSTAVVYYDNGGGIQDSLRVVIRDESVLRGYWQRATSTQQSPPPLPAVDFSREMILLVAAGRMTPADQIHVDSVGVGEEMTGPSTRQRVLEAVVRTVRGCQAFSSDAYPVMIVRVQRVDGQVRFTERRERAEGCEGTASRQASGAPARHGAR